MRVIVPPLVILLGVLLAACTTGLVPRVKYSVRPMAVVPLGSTVTDSGKAFAEMFCAVLPTPITGSGADAARISRRRSACKRRWIR